MAGFENLVKWFSTFMQEQRSEGPSPAEQLLDVADMFRKCRRCKCEPCQKQLRYAERAIPAHVQQLANRFYKKGKGYQFKALMEGLSFEKIAEDCGIK